MDSRKWLKRKYPETIREVSEFLNDDQLYDFRKGKFKLGRFSKDCSRDATYAKGKIIMFKRSNPVKDYNYPLHYAVTKCAKGLTWSGYHGFFVTERDIAEIFK